MYGRGCRQSTFSGSFNNTRNDRRGRISHNVEAVMPYVRMRTNFPWKIPLTDMIPAWCPDSVIPKSHHVKSHGHKTIRATRTSQQGTFQTLFSRIVLDREVDPHQPRNYQSPRSGYIHPTPDTHTSSPDSSLPALQPRNGKTWKTSRTSTTSYKKRPSCTPMRQAVYIALYLKAERAWGVSTSLAAQKSTHRRGRFSTILVYSRTLYGILMPMSVSTYGRWLIICNRFNTDPWIDATPAVKEHMVLFIDLSRTCIGKDIARLMILHAALCSFRECPDIDSAPGMTEKIRSRSLPY